MLCRTRFPLFERAMMQILRLMGLLSLAFLLLGSLSCNAADAPIPEGEYNCHKISGTQLIHLATLEIKGSTYRVSKDEPFAPFTIDDKKIVTWTKGLRFLPEGW